MNAPEFTGTTGHNLFHLRDIFRYICRFPDNGFRYDANGSQVPISFMIISCSLIILFSGLVRAILSFISNVSWTWLTTRITTNISLSDTLLNPKTVNERQEKLVNDMKKRAAEFEFQRREADHLRKEELTGQDISSMQPRYRRTSECIEMV